MTRVVVGSLVIAVGAQLQVPLPPSPVPVTGQTFAVLIVGAALGFREGAAAALLYVIEGTVGLPVFAGGTAGIARLLGPTGGYLVGFVFAAAVIGSFAERGWDRRLPTAVVAMLVGEFVIFAFGLVWLGRFPLPIGLFEAGLYPFIVGEVYKVLLAALLLPTAWYMVRGSRAPSTQVM